MPKSTKATPLENTTEVSNSLTQLATNVGAINPFGAQVSQADSFFYNQRNYLITNMRQLLADAYVEFSLVQTIVDLPVDDAFRTGFEIKSAQLDANDTEILWNWLKKNQVIETIKYACKWARLNGGGAVIPVTDQNPAMPLNIAAIKKDSRLEFKAVDQWELFWSQTNSTLGEYDNTLLQKEQNTFYDYYGIRLHHSRVLAVKGKEAPSFIRPRLRGWGLSVLEVVVRNMNTYMKNQNVVFELLDEAKVDVYAIEGFSQALLTKDGTNVITKRVQLGNMVKNYLNALVMDAKDKHEQKQMNFTGLSDVMVQNRIGIAADLRMPITKIFGMSATGFNSGEDDIENYNAMVQSEIRAKVEYIVVDVLGIVCQKLFGFVPDDLQIVFNPMREMTPKDEQEVKDKKFNRLTTALREGAIDHPTWAEGVNKDSLLPVEVDETAGMQVLDNDDEAPE